MAKKQKKEKEILEDETIPVDDLVYDIGEPMTRDGEKDKTILQIEFPKKVDISILQGSIDPKFYKS